MKYVVAILLGLLANIVIYGVAGALNVRVNTAQITLVCAGMASFLIIWMWVLQ